MQFSSIFMIFNTLQIIYAINSAIFTKNQEKEEHLTFFFIIMKFQTPTWLN